MNSYRKSDMFSEPQQRLERRVHDERTIILEQRVSGLNTSVNRVEGKIDGIVDALAGIVRIEERQIQNGVKVAEAHAEIERHGQRLHAIEIQMPGLTEKASWVVKALLATAAVVGLALIAVVVK